MQDSHKQHTSGQNSDQVEEEKSQADKKASELQEFQREMRAKRFRDGETAPSVDPKDKKSIYYKFKFPPKLPEEIDQPKAKTCLPPAVGRIYVWRSRTEGAWIAKYDSTLFSRSWHAHGGQRSACIAVLKAVWSRWLDEKLLLPKDCPIKGIFSEGKLPCEGVAPVKGVASSSSGKV